LEKPKIEAEIIKGTLCLLWLDGKCGRRKRTCCSNGASPSHQQWCPTAP